MGRAGIVRVNGVNAKQGPRKIRAKCLVGVTEAGTDGALCPGVPVLGGPDCGLQVPGALSVCTITHFLHEVIYLDTRG